jgi:ATP-dependent protease ClpP protease subunit
MSYLGPLPRKLRLFNTHMTAGARQAFLAGHGGVRMEGAAAGGQPAATIQQDRVWYRITNNAGGPAVVDIFDEIGYWGTNAADFQRELAAITAPDITVNLNSPGGEIFEGIAIHNALRSHPAAVTVRVAGLAASIASVIALAGDRVIMQPHSQMMIHDGSGFCIGDAREMREMADLLDKQSNNIAAVYAERAGGTVEEWRERMLAETWYSADEAVEAGLADEVDSPAWQGQEPAPAAQPAAKWDLTVFRHAGREQAPAPVLNTAATTEAPVEETSVVEEQPLAAEPTAEVEPAIEPTTPMEPEPAPDPWTALTAHLTVPPAAPWAALTTHLIPAASPSAATDA